MAAGHARPVTEDIHTVHLGAYTHAHAEAIAGELEKAGIVWWYKAPGFFSQIWERSIRLFVDRDRLDEAGVSFAYLFNHEMPDGSYRIVTVPVN